MRDTGNNERVKMSKDNSLTRKLKMRSMRIKAEVRDEEVMIVMNKRQR